MSCVGAHSTNRLQRFVDLIGERRKFVQISMFKAVGGDAIGMSTCHEVTVARQCDMKVFGFSLITNIANLDTDTAVKVTHEEVLQIAKEGGERATAFVREIIRRIP